MTALPSASTFGLPALSSTGFWNDWPMIDEPTVFPPCLTSEPLAAPGEDDLADAGDGERVEEAERERGEHDRDGG